MRTLSRQLSQEMMHDLLSGGQIIRYIDGDISSVLIKLASTTDGYLYHQYDDLEGTDTYYLAVRRSGRIDHVIKQFIIDTYERRNALKLAES